MKTRQAIINSVCSDVRNLISESDNNVLTKNSILECISSVLCDAGVDSEIVVDILEKFGEEGKYWAMAIKVNEGW